MIAEGDPESGGTLQIEPAEPESPPAPFDGDGYCWLAMAGEELKWALGIAVLRRHGLKHVRFDLAMVG